MFRKTLLIIFRALLLPILLSVPPTGSVQGQAGSLRFETLSVEDGLSQSNVQSILQDSRGFMWFGTEDGLNKYDGYSFTIYKHDPDDQKTISDNSILSIFEDSHKNLWIGTARGLNRFEPKSETFFRYLNDPDSPLSLSGSVVTAIVEDPEGDLWIGTDAGLNRLLNLEGSFKRIEHNPMNWDSLSSNQVTALAIDPKGGLWVGTSDGLDFYDYVTNRVTRYHHDPMDALSLSSNKILSLLFDHYGLLWVGTEDEGINRFNAANQTFIRYKNRPGNPYSLVSNDIRTIFEDSKDRLWVGTRKALHLLQRNEDYFMHYLHDPKDPYSLSSDHILSLYEDRSGVFWIGTFSGGVNKYNQTSDRFMLYQYQPGVTNSLSDNMVNAIFEDQEGVVWIGTMDGGLNRMNSETFTFTSYTNDPQDPTSLGHNDVRAILQDRTGALWVGTYGGGLNLFNPETGQFKRFLHQDKNPLSLSDDRVISLLEDRRGNLWVGTYDGLNIMDDRSGGVFRRFLSDPRYINTLRGNQVRAIFEDQNGYLWVGTNNGITVIDPVNEKFRYYQNDQKNRNSLSSDRVLSFFETPDGIIWIGTMLGGLNRFDPATETFRHFTQKNGLPNDSVFGILSDHEGNLWLSTNFGLSRFNPQTETFRNYDVQDGLQGNEFNPGAYFKNKRGTLFFGGVKGFNFFTPRNLVDNPIAPPVVITAFKKFNHTEIKDLDENQEIVLTYHDNFISFEFSALDFSTPNKNQYAYKLEGFDRDWIYSGTRRYTSYTNLKGGEYVFHVKGANKDGVWNETGTNIRIRIIPPIWERWWFIILMGLTSVSIAAGALWMRDKRVKQEQKKLEDLVRERTAQIVHSASEIERRRQVAESLRDILTILNSNMPLKECLDRITQQAIRLMDARAAVIFRCGENSLPVVVAYNIAYVSPETDPHTETMPVIFTPEWISKPVLAGEMLIVQDITAFATAQPTLIANLADFTAKDWQSNLLNEYKALLAVPLILNDEVDGGLLLAYKQPKLFSEEDQQTARSFADHAALAIANAMLRSQAEELAVSAERSRLARDLHDAVTQTLFATSLIADILPRLWERNPDAGKIKLVEIRELTRGALAEMRTLLMELRPTALDDVPLPDLLQQLGEALTGRARVPVELDLDRNITLPPNVKIGFYRIAQEALNNISKHARASHVNIQLKRVNGYIEMGIGDDGIGFDLAKNQPDHFGLEIMKERAQTVGAQIHIESIINKGTQVKIWWDIK